MPEVSDVRFVAIVDGPAVDGSAAPSEGIRSPGFVCIFFELVVWECFVSHVRESPLIVQPLVARSVPAVFQLRWVRTVILVVRRNQLTYRTDGADEIWW